MESFLLLLTLLRLSFFVCYAESNFSVTDNAKQQLPVLFTRSVYRGSIREHFPFKNETIRQPVTIVPAIRIQRTVQYTDGTLAITELDTRSSISTVRYSILSGNDDGYFGMDPNSGDLFLVRQVDREQLPASAINDRFTLTIQASSLSETSARARIFIDIEDINDNVPLFDTNEYSISIVENLPVSFHVLQLSATDIDLGENGKFTYRLNDTSGAFVIDPVTGWLSVTNSTPLDRERVAKLTLLVEAVEQKPNLLTDRLSTARIDIELTDANDNSPIFQPTNLYSFVVEALAGAGTVIGQVEAIDADADDNGLVNYVIQHQQEGVRSGKASKTGRNVRLGPVHNLTAKNGDPDVPFSIHPRSGHVIVTDTPLTKKSYSLFVEASDQPANPSERRHSLAVVQISVVASSMMVPHFANTPYEFWVGAEAPVDTSVGQVKIEGILEHDDVRYTMKHKLRNAGMKVPFNVDAKSGIIRVTDDLKAPTTFTLNVTANNNNRDPVTTTLTIHVVDQSISGSHTSKKLHEQGFYHFSVVENAPAGPFGEIIYQPTNADESETGTEETFQFVPLDQKAVGWGYFRLSRNGTLYTRRSLDRELMTSNLTLFVTVLENEQNRDTLQVTVTIVDVNDNPPVFNKQRYLGRVAENSAAGTRVRLVQAIRSSDADSWPHNVVHYSLTGNGSRLFRIDPIGGELSVVRSKSLDRERTPFYNLTVTATDGSLNSNAQLTILVEDVNDNAPIISGFFPTVGVVALERSANRQEFRDEGVIIVCADGSCSTPIDVEEREPQELPPGRLMATYSRFRNHLLRVLDDWIDQAERSIDQTPPDEEEILERAFQEILYNSSILIQVPDNFLVNSSLGLFSIEDKDEVNPVKSDELYFSLVPGTRHDDSFGVVPESGSLYLKKPLQLDTVYLIDVQVNDQQGLRSAANVAIQLTEVNHHRPMFNSSYYELLLPEGDYNDSSFITIEAYDQDTGDNGRLVYSLTDSSASPFRINHKTGLLIVNGSIDREQTEFFRFVVQATDEGFPPLKSRVDVVVYITDINDNAPVFDLPAGSVHENGLQPLFSVSLTDGTPPGTPVLRVRATDADADFHTNGNVTYRLGSHQSQFSIDKITGSISTLVAMDRARSESEHNLLVVATDGGTPRLSTISVVRVTIIEACQPDPAARRQQSITLDENIPTPIALINLTSDGEKSNELVHLSLLQIEPNWPDAQSRFKLDNAEPVLWLTEPLDREVQDSYSVHLKVQHSGRRSNSTNNSSCSGFDEEELVLNIRVADVNDNAPVFAEQNPLIVVVPSNTPIGYPVITIAVTDADDGNNAAIKYSMTPDAVISEDYYNPLDWTAAFLMDPSSGVVSVASAVDRLVGRILSFQINATDRNGSGQSATSTLHLSLHILDRSHEVVLVLATTTEDLVIQSEHISRVISDVSGTQVWIRSLEPHLDGDTIDGSMTDVFIYASSRTNESIITSEDFLRLLNVKKDELDQKLANYNLREIRQTSRNTKSLPSIPDIKIDVLEVTLIAMGAAVLLGAIVAVVCIFLSRLKHKKRSKPVVAASTMARSMAMDYHLQSVRNMTVVSSSYNDSSQAELMSRDSSASSDNYFEVPVDKGHPLYVSALPPAHQKQRYKKAASTPSCPSCKRVKAHRCKCSGKRQASATRSLPGSDSWVLKRKTDDPFCRLHSLPPTSRTRLSTRAEPEMNSSNSKLVRLHLAPRRTRSMRVEQTPSTAHYRQETGQPTYSRQLNKSHRSKNHCCQHNRQRRPSSSSSPSSPSLVQVERRQIFSRPIGVPRYPKSGSTTETFDDSLESTSRHTRRKW